MSELIHDGVINTTKYIWLVQFLYKPTESSVKNNFLRTLFDVPIKNRKKLYTDKNELIHTVTEFFPFLFVSIAFIRF